MTLSDVLQLPKTQGSIKKIDLYMAKLNKNSKEYLIALSCKANVLCALNKHQEGLKLLFPFVENFKDYDNDAVIAICDSIIDICLDAKNYPLVEKYILLKNKYLPVSKQTLHLKDEIKYYTAINNPLKIKEVLLKLLDDDTTKDEKLYAKEKLCEIYFKEKQYDKYMEYIPDLEDFYQANMVVDKLNLLSLNKLKIAYIRENYTKVIVEGSSFIDDTTDVKIIIQIATLLINSYVLSSDYKRGAIVESKYCDYISKQYIDESLAFANAAYNLYKACKNIISIKEYEKKIKELETEKKEINKEIVSSKKEEIPVVFEPKYLHIDIEKKQEDNYKFNGYLNDDTNVDENTNLKTHKDSLLPTEVLVNGYTKLADIFKEINNIDFSTKFREQFRKIGIEIEKNLGIDEIYILYFDRKYLGLHYKKERVYDKVVSFDDIEGTLNYASINSSHEEFLDQANQEYTKNIIDFKPFTSDIYGFCLPLKNQIETIGSIAYFSKTSFLAKELEYESLLLISQMINTKLLMCMKQRKYEFSNYKIFFLYENMPCGIKEQNEGAIHLSKKASDILGILPNISINDFTYNMPANDAGMYLKKIDEIYTLSSLNEVVLYDYKKGDSYLRIKETFYTVNYDGNIYLYSLIEDITEQKRTNDRLLDLAYTNPISNMNTEFKLVVDLKNEYSSKKLSLAIFEVKDIDLYLDLYGYRFKNQVIKQIGIELKNAFINDMNYSFYHFDNGKYAVLLKDVNDKRVVDLKMNHAFNYISKELNDLNKRVVLKFLCGVYRLGKNVNLEDSALIISYANDALLDAKDFDDDMNHICHYDGNKQKEKFHINSLIVTISEDIDQNKIGVIYSQIVNVSENKIFAFKVNYSLDNYNVDYELVYKVAKRKGKIKALEQKLFLNTIVELKSLYDECKTRITCFVPISEESINIDLLKYVEANKNHYKINTTQIVFEATSTNFKVFELIRKQGYFVASHSISDVLDNKCDYFYYNYHTNTYNLDELKELCKKHNVELMLDEINDKIDLDFAKSSYIDYVFGDVYSKVYRMKSLIELYKKILNQGNN